MAVPKKKVSKSRSKRRVATWERLTLKKITEKYHVIECKNCGSSIVSHTICKHCGYYGWKQFLTIKTKSKETVLDA